MSESHIERGSVIRLWHHPKGHDYVVVGRDTDNKKLHLLKLNCINQDGSIHGSTKKLHKSIPYSTITHRDIANNVNKVMGSIDTLDLTACETLISKHNEKTGENIHLLPALKKYVCSPRSDNTISVTYN